MAREYDNIADAISAVNGEVSEQSGKIADILEALEGKAGGITPTGKINITNTNATDVTNYATAQVVSENIKPENIKKNINILGVIGEFEGGGGGNAVSGSITLAAQSSSDIPIPHGLSENPACVVVWTDTIGTEATIPALRGGIYIEQNNTNIGLYTRVGRLATELERLPYFYVDDENITLIDVVSPGYHWEAGATIYWMACKAVSE